MDRNGQSAIFSTKPGHCFQLSCGAVIPRHPVTSRVSSGELQQNKGKLMKDPGGGSLYIPTSHPHDSFLSVLLLYHLPLTSPPWSTIHSLFVQVFLSYSTSFAQWPSQGSLRYSRSCHSLSSHMLHPPPHYQHLRHDLIRYTSK